jgi:hypothetical protein
MLTAYGCVQIADIIRVDKFIPKSKRLKLSFNALPALLKIPRVDDKNSIKRQQLTVIIFSTRHRYELSGCVKENRSILPLNISAKSVLLAANSLR